MPIKWGMAVVLVLGVGLAAPVWASEDRDMSRLRSHRFSDRVAAIKTLSGSASTQQGLRALSQTVVRDASATVRALAAKALGRLVDVDTDVRVRADVIRALARAEADSSPKVRSQARRALATVSRHALSPTPDQPRTAEPVMVRIRRPSGELPKGSAKKLHRSVERMVAKHAPGRVGRGDTTRDGLLLSSRVASLEVRRQGSKAVVRCAVSMRLARLIDGQELWRSGRMAIATGNGSVEVHSRDVRRASEKCVLTVFEDVTEQKMAPFLSALL